MSRRGLVREMCENKTSLFPFSPLPICPKSRSWPVFIWPTWGFNGICNSTTYGKPYSQSILCSTCAELSDYLQSSCTICIVDKRGQITGHWRSARKPPRQTPGLSSGTLDSRSKIPSGRASSAREFRLGRSSFIRPTLMDIAAQDCGTRPSLPGLLMPQSQFCKQSWVCWDWKSHESRTYASNIQVAGLLDPACSEYQADRSQRFTPQNWEPGWHSKGGRLQPSYETSHVAGEGSHTVACTWVRHRVCLCGCWVSPVQMT